MRPLYLQGCGTALVTPFTQSGEVDYPAYINLVKRQVENGVDFLVPLATTGETPTLSAEEKQKIFALTKEHCGGLPLVAGCGSNSLPATIENIRNLEAWGADALLVVVPFYNKPTQEGQYQYFKAVAEATEKPIVVYNVPGRTGANMSADTIIRLADEFENIIATKEASGNYSQVSDIIRRAPAGFSVLSGDDDMTFALMATGGHGVISVASNLAPAEVSSMTRAMIEGDVNTARELHHRLFPLFKARFVESNPIPVKAGMASMGLMEKCVRLPLSVASEKTENVMSEVIRELWK
ncbi:MAG: 4-hydroxy-tetrahydrodipicolinate synthase [Bacteroidales bacterium]|nr:4-hydroxy-tetrahydrodipicolinate synthase [Bacteroidales bacterium]